MKFILSLFVCLFSVAVFAKTPTLQTVSTERNLLQYQINGQLKGPSAEIYKMLMAESGLSISVDFMPWARAYQTAETTPNTIIFSIIRNDEREDKFHWLIPVSELIQTFIGKSADTSKKQYSLARIRSKLTVVERNTFGHIMLLNKGFIEGENLYVVSSAKAAIRLFFEGKVDFIFTEPNVIRSKIKQYNLKETDLVMAPILGKAKRQSYIAINKSSDELIVNLLKKAANKVYQMPAYKKHFYYIDK